MTAEHQAGAQGHRTPLFFYFWYGARSPSTPESER